MQTESSKLFTRDIAAFSDAELDQYLEANAGEIDVEDPDILKDDEVLLRRLRARAGAINLDDLTARLENIPADRQWEAWHTGLDENGNRVLHYASRDTTEPLDEDEEYRRGLEEETEYYNTLVSEGGRPSHPLDLLGRDVFENPGEYGEILSYWQRVPEAGFGPWQWKVFGSQLWEWRRFCKYQRSTRKEGYFPTYRLLVQKRLTRHGFERPFQLDEDLDQQDKLATWIEFLNYEYQDYDKDMRFVERHQAEYDAAWKELVDSQVLRPFETEEFICNIKSAFHHASEEERAEKAVESARSTVISVQNAVLDPRHARLSEQEPQQRAAAAQSQLAAAIKSLESIKRRNDLVHEFYKRTQLDQVVDGKLKRSYQSAKDDAERRSILLRWILQQIPLIELELNKAEVGENNSHVGDGMKRRKRQPTDDLTLGRVPKRRREDNRNNALSTCRTCASTAPTTSQDSSMQRLSQTAGHEGQLKRNCRDATDEERVIKRPRHSGQTSNAAEPEPLSIQSDRSEPDNSAAQVPKPLKRQAKVYKKERESRRIAGHSPQFGMLPKRGVPAPPYEPPSRYPSGPRSRASSKKKPIAVTGGSLKGFRSRGKRGRTVQGDPRSNLVVEHTYKAEVSS